MSEFGVDLLSPAGWLPLVFALVMALSMLAYVILDGYDLGVGALLDSADTIEHKNTMIASIGPFWDANETWLVLGVGIMLIAFPSAHSLILFHLYLPATVMLIGLILRGVAFDFRAKAPEDHKNLWDTLFKVGSLLATLSQGFMLGRYVMGFEQSLAAYLFAGLSAVCVPAAYSAPESLLFIFYGAAIVLPTILLYTIFSYRVFWGKATQLKYY